MNQVSMDQQLAFIGAGNMARSLIGGLIDNGYPAQAICASDVSTETLDKLAGDFGVRTEPDNLKAASSADVVVLAVKPQQMREVCSGLSAMTNRSNPLVVSIAAGIRADAIERWLGGSPAVVRCMPNTPALVKCGASGLYANSHTSPQQCETAASILAAVSTVVWVEHERDIDAVTAVSGSGPAYYFLLIEAMQTAAMELGLSSDQARILVEQTALGAASMAKSSELAASTLRENVTSKGGTTAAALDVFERGELRELVTAAMRAAANRSAELGDQLGEQ